MTRNHARRYNMLVRIRNFGAAHGQLFPETSTAHAAFAVIGAEVARLDALDVAERSASQLSRAGEKRAARKALAVSLTLAGSAARVVAKANPAFKARIDLPLPFDAVPLLTMARQFAAAAAPSATEFAAHGVPIPELEGRIAAFEQALHERRVSRDDRVKARADLEASFARAMDAVAVLDVAVPAVLASDTALTVWKYDRRLDYPQRTRTAGDGEQPVPTTAPGHAAPPAQATTPPAEAA